MVDFVILNANKVVSKTIANNKIPTPKWIATKTAWSLRSITNAPNVICVITSVAAKVLVNLIFLSAFLFIQQATDVAITRVPVVAATSLWTHSIKYSSFGKTPLGQRGHSGHVNPSPAADTYPPTNIREYNTIRVAKARYWRANTILQ